MIGAETRSFKFGQRTEVTHRIGSGGLADVYLGTYRKGGSEETLSVAVKTPNKTSLLSGDAQAQSCQEAFALSQLKHPSFPKLFEYDVTSSGLPFMVMEYIGGKSLQKRLDTEGPLKPAEALEITRQVAGALEHLHSTGRTHGDIKPANILLPTGSLIKLVDLGSSQLLGTERQSADSGTFSFMAPEQFKNSGEVTPSVDVYALGIALYQMLTNTVPFHRDPAISATQKEKMVPKLPRESNQAITTEVDCLVAKMLAIAPEQRYQTATDLLADLNVR